MWHLGAGPALQDPGKARLERGDYRTMSEDFWIALGTALGLVLVLEGLAYTLFPAALKRMMAAMQDMPPETLRRVGAFLLTIGVMMVWLIRG